MRRPLSEGRCRGRREMCRAVVADARDPAARRARLARARPSVWSASHCPGRARSGLPPPRSAQSGRDGLHRPDHVLDGAECVFDQTLLNDLEKLYPSSRQVGPSPLGGAGRPGLPDDRTDWSAFRPSTSWQSSGPRTVCGPCRVRHSWPGHTCPPSAASVRTRPTKARPRRDCPPGGAGRCHAV